MRVLHALLAAVYIISNAVLARNNQPLTAKACYPPEITVKQSITNLTKMHYF